MSQNGNAPAYPVDNVDGLSGYDILQLPGCPYVLPTARTMTTARIDYYSMLPGLQKWYLEVYKSKTKEG